MQYILPGMPCIYYGDEIGMRNIKGLFSREGGYSRTQSRTPMQWNSGSNVGFSTADADKLYLPVDTAADAPNVSEQQIRPNSLLNNVRELIKMRRAHEAFNSSSEFELLLADYPLVYTRKTDKEKVLIVIQPARRTWNTEIAVPETVTELVPILNSGIDAEITENKIKLSGTAGTQYGIWQII